MVIPLAGWVAPFGDPGITDRSHLPRAFRSVPRPSSPLSAKASTKCPYALDPKPLASHTESKPPMPQDQGLDFSTTQHSCFTRLAAPVRPHQSASPKASPPNGRQQAAASRIPLHNANQQRTEDGAQRTEPPNHDLALTRSLTRNLEATPITAAAHLL